MVERGRELRLGPEPPQEAGVVGERGVKHLHRDATAKADIVGHVHPAARARSDGTEQAVATSEHTTDEVGNGASGHSHEGTGRYCPDPRHPTDVRTRHARVRATGRGDGATARARRYRADPWMTAPRTPTAPRGAPRRASKPPLFRHPKRVAIVGGTLFAIVVLVAIAIGSADTSNLLTEQRQPKEVQGFSPQQSAIVPPNTPITVDLRTT